MDLSTALDDEIKQKERVKAFKLSSAVKELKINEETEWGKTDPSKYYDVYPIRAKLPNEKDLKNAFLNGRATHGNALLARKSLMILPGMYSHDEDFLLFLRELSTDLDSKYQPDLDKEGFTKTGCTPHSTPCAVLQVTSKHRCPIQRSTTRSIVKSSASRPVIHRDRRLSRRNFGVSSSRKQKRVPSTRRRTVLVACVVSPNLFSGS